MPSKVPFCTEVKLKSVPLPNHGGRYAAVPHGFIIDEVKKELFRQLFIQNSCFYQ